MPTLSRARLAMAWRLVLLAGAAASLGSALGPMASGQTISAQPLPPPAGTTHPADAAPAHVEQPASKHAAHSVERHAHRTAHAGTAHAETGTTSAARKPVKPTKSAAGAHVAAKPVKPAKAAVPQAAAQAAKPAVAAAPRPDPNKGTSTGLALPRWVSFRSDEVNLRSGPGMQYPIQWVYHRRDYPVQIVREFDVWRLILTEDGTKGWVHQATLTGRRGFVVDGATQVLRASAAETADPVAQLMPGVVGLLRKCPAGLDWCEVQAGGYKGWLKRAVTYGVSPSEVIG